MGNDEHIENWLRIDEVTDVDGSVRHALRCASFVRDDPYTWKWIILALHSALQGACVAHLTTTASPLGAVTKRNAKEWKIYFDQSWEHDATKTPETFLMNLPDLLKSIRKANSVGSGGNAAGIVICDSEFEWLKRIHNELRNQFTHFEPMSWSIELTGLPKLISVMVRIILEIIEAGWGFRHLDSAQIDELKINLRELKRTSW